MSEEINTSRGLSEEELRSSYGNLNEGHLAFEQQLNEETTGVLGHTGDILTGIGHGAMDAVDETLQFGAGIVDGTLEKAGELVGKDWDIIDDTSYQGEILQFFPRPVTTAGKMVEDITQFGVGLIGAGKLTAFTRGVGLNAFKNAGKDSLKGKVGKGVYKGLGKNAKGRTKFSVLTAESATAALVVQDPYEDTLAEIMQHTPALANPVADFLANKIGDSELTMRLKNVGEDIVFSLGLEGLIRTVKLARAAKEAEVIKEAIPDKGAPKPRETPQAAKAAPKSKAAPEVSPEDVKAFDEKAAQQQAEKDAGVSFESYVNKLGDEAAKANIQHVLNAHQAGMGVGDYLRSLPPAEVDDLIHNIAPELRHYLENARYLRAAEAAGDLQAGVAIDKAGIEASIADIYNRLGATLEEGVNVNVADAGDIWETLKGVKDKSTKGAKEAANKKGTPGNTPKDKAKGVGNNATPEGSNTSDYTSAFDDVPDIEPFPPEVLESISSAMNKLRLKVEELSPDQLTTKYMAIIKDKTRGLSGKYWDSPLREKQITEHLRVNVLNPILKANQGTLGFQQVQQNFVARTAELSGMHIKDLNNLVESLGATVQEASEIFMVHELRVNDAWTQAMETMRGLKEISNPGQQLKQQAEFLLQVRKLAEMSKSGQALESAFGRALGQRRMTFKSVDGMTAPELQKIINVNPTDPIKSQEQIAALIKNMELADGDMVKATKIAREFGKYQGIEKFMASMTEMWRGALLMNFSTNITNMASGFAESFIIPVERLIGSSMMMAWDPAAKKANEQAWLHLRNMGEGFKHGFAAMNYAFKHEVQALDPFKGGMIEMPGKGMGDLTHAEMAQGSPFQMTAENWNLADSSFLGQMINGVGKTFRMSFRFLGAQDELIKQTTYFASLKSKYQMQVAEKVSSREITAKQAEVEVAKLMKKHFNEDGFTPKMGKDGNLATDVDALDMAQDVTHTKEAWEGSIVKNLQKTVNSNPALGIFLPFIRTPSDLINKAYQRTPLLGMVSHRMRKDFAEGGTKRAQWLGRQTVGFGVVGMGLMAVKDGKLTGKGPDDPRANKIWRLTHQPNSIMVDGTWVSYNKMDPCGMLLGVIANGAEAANNEALTEGTDASDVTQAIILAVTATIGDKSSLRGVINLTTLFSDQVIGKKEATENILEDHVASWVPSILTQVSGAFQDTTYIKEADGFIEKLMRKSPWHQQDLPDRYNWITGSKEKIPTGNSWGIPRLPESHDWMLKELANLNHGFSGPTRSFNGIELSSHQFSEWCQLMGTISLGGRTMTQALQRVMKSSQYDYDPRRQYFQEQYGEEPLQVALIKRVMRRYKAEAKRILLQNNPNLTPQTEDFSSLFGG